jgi:alcohol dehydrogenase
MPTISAAVDSMVHAVEAFAAKKTNRIARFFAIEGFRRVFEALPFLIDDLGNYRLREEVMFGAFLSGVALMHSGTGPAAAMSYPMSVHYHVPHGLGGGIFLPHVIEYNIKAGYTGYAALYNPNRLDAKQAQSTFLAELNECWIKLQVPQNLNKLGIKNSDVGFIIDETMQLKGALDQNPVPFYENEIKQILTILTDVKNQSA